MSIAMQETLLPLMFLETVLFPGQRMLVTVREESAAALIRYIMETGERFGVIWKEAKVGCVARVERELGVDENGFIEVLVVGEERFRLREIRHERRYPMGVVEWIPEPVRRIHLPLRERAITQHIKFLEMTGKPLRLHIYEDVRRVSYVIAQQAGLTQAQRQHMLELASENERIAFLVRHFAQLLPRMEEVQLIRKKIRSNGHFKENPPILGSES